MKQKGDFYEHQASHWLQKKGLKPVSANYHSRFGEIDLIMLDQSTLCFVEVKFRQSQSFGGAAYSITKPKQKKIIATALSFIAQHKEFLHHAYRFDAILVNKDANGKDDINWIQSAFSAEEY